MKRKPRKTKKDPQSILNKLPASERQVIATYITLQSAAGYERSVLAGAHVLKDEFGFSDEQVKAWAEVTTLLTAKYLRLQQ